MCLVRLCNTPASDQATKAGQAEEVRVRRGASEREGKGSRTDADEGASERANERTNERNGRETRKGHREMWRGEGSSDGGEQEEEVGALPARALWIG